MFTARSGFRRRGAALPSFLQPGRNVWRAARATRAAMLIDAAPYFAAARAAMLAARHTIHIVGWDLDGETPFHGAEGATDGLPETLGAFLTALVARRPELKIRLLLWDHSLFYVFERDLVPNYACLWDAPKQIEICLDDVLPIGGCHHQKLVVIDERLAFCGGIDLTRRRWDTPEHLPDDPRRVDPSGESYAPFHDAALMLDGDAARALGDLVRLRWNRSACDRLPAKALAQVAEAPGPDIWPAEVTPEFADVAVGIARTQPQFGRERMVNEVEILFADMIDAARDRIHIENQYLTATAFGARLARRLRANPALDALVVTPARYDSWLLKATMAGGRARFMDNLAQAGCDDCVRLRAPEVRHGETTASVMVHAKLMIVDDILLRVGSANICNRSMGLDTECDVVLVAETEAHRAAIQRVQNRLIAEHLGVAPDAVGAEIAARGSFFEALDRLKGVGDGTRRLVPVKDDDVRTDFEMSPFDALADPPEALIDEGPDAMKRPLRPLPLLGKIAAVAAVFLAVALLWQTSAIAEPSEIFRVLDRVARMPWTEAVVIAAFLAGGFVAVPVTLMIVATLVVFNGWPGVALAGAGALASAVATYIVGRRLGTGVLRRYLGPRLNRIRRVLPERSLWRIATVRMAPIAPFFLVNLVAGAAGVRFHNYVAGSLLGLLPDVVLIAVLVQQSRLVLADPGPDAILVLFGLVAAWGTLSLAISILVVRRWRLAPLARGQG
jgi:phospholipase D1/2